MISRFPKQLSNHTSRQSNNLPSGFSLLEVIIAIGVLGFGVAIVMRLLSGSLETLMVVRGANQALDLVPVINLKLENPSVDIPILDDNGNQTTIGDADVAFQRRFFNKVFEIIQDKGAVQLLVYQYPREKLIGKSPDDSEHGYNLGVRFIPLKPLDNELQKYFPSKISKIKEDYPAEIYRVIISASSANDQEKLQTRTANDQEQERGEDKVPVFAKYDIKSGIISGSASGKSIYVCQLNKSLKPDDHLFLAVQIHIFRQSDNPSRSNSKASMDLWDRTLHIEDRLFTYNTSMLAY
jgi:prepilin-type N-terminal cleavage/methylation domain-containing protein